MTSNDKQEYITVEMFNDGLKEIKSEFKEIKTEIREIKYENQLNSAKIEWLQHSIYWGFAIIGVIIAFVSLYPFRREKTENEIQQKETLTEARVERIAETIAEKVVGKALAGISR